MVESVGIEPLYLFPKQGCITITLHSPYLAGMAGFEPANVGVMVIEDSTALPKSYLRLNEVPCLTAWLHPYIPHVVIDCVGPLSLAEQRGSEPPHRFPDLAD